LLSFCGVLIVVHLKTLETKVNAQDRKYWKLALICQMFELEQEFKRELQTVENSFKMPYISSLEKNGLEQGEKIGMQKGIQKGMQEGIQKGKEEGMQKGKEEGSLEEACSMLLRILERRFGPVPEGFVKKVNSASLPEIHHWTDLSLDAEKLEDIFS
jgi:hypothetical protein